MTLLSGVSWGDACRTHKSLFRVMWENDTNIAPDGGDKGQLLPPVVISAYVGAQGVYHWWRQAPGQLPRVSGPPLLVSSFRAGIYPNKPF